MGHAHHFLSRLDRVSFDHVELSLALYRDEPLLRHILASARIPEQSERVAISLDHPEEGPFLVITRDGHFVTCLGAGMRPKNLFVISREKLDAIMHKTEVLRERFAQARALAGDRAGRVALIRRIYEAGPELSREEMRKLVAIQPFLWPQFFDWMLEAHRAVYDIRQILLREHRRTDKLAPRHDDLLSVYWKFCWTTGHLLALSVAGAPTQFEGMSSADIESIARLDCWRIGLETGIMGITLRGVWATARLGKLALPQQKRRYQGAERYIDVVSAGLSLLAIGQRHARLRAEVGKTLEARPKLVGTDLVTELVHYAAEQLADQWHTWLDTPDVYASLHRENGADLAVFAARTVPPGSPYRFTKMDDVPEDLANCLAAISPLEWMDSPEWNTSLGASALWAARASLEDLYLPADYINAAQGLWTKDWARLALQSAREDFLWARQSDQGPQGPARKAPCPCGSGKKYKRCCGA